MREKRKKFHQQQTTPPLLTQPHGCGGAFNNTKKRCFLLQRGAAHASQSAQVPPTRRRVLHMHR
jgi:hypothetical protein